MALTRRCHRRKPANKPMPEATARAGAKLTLTNLAYSFDPLIFHERRRAAAQARQEPGAERVMGPSMRSKPDKTARNHAMKRENTEPRQRRIKMERFFAGVQLMRSAFLDVLRAFPKD